MTLDPEKVATWGASRCRAHGLVLAGEGIRVRSQPAYNALRALGFFAAQARSSARRCWTTPEGQAALRTMISMIDQLRRRQRTFTVGQLAARVATQPELLTQYDAAVRLGAADEALSEMLTPLLRRHNRGAV